MKTHVVRTSLVAGAAAVLLGASTLAGAAVAPLGPGAPITSGSAYDRNPSVVQDGAVTRAFFARTEDPGCNRLAPDNCPADNTTYDLYEMDSLDGGQTW